MAATPVPMKLHAVYRATGKANTKPRPAGFSKLRSLESFLGAWAVCPARGDLVFLIDGPVPPEQRALMDAAGRVVASAAVDSQGAFWSALELALGAGWAGDDLVYFGEDDYLYRRDTFAAVIAAAGAIPRAAYFAPYATIGHTMPNGEPLHEGLRRPRVRDEAVAEIDGVTWHRATSHTVSFAVRLRALHEDRALYRVALRCSGAWDHTMCLAYQGLPPYAPADLLSPLRAATGASPSRRVKVAIWRVLVTAMALGPRRHGHVLVAPRPALATHMEVGLLATGTEWTSPAVNGGAAAS